MTMTCSSKGGDSSNNDHHNHSMFTTKTPHFFKVILERSIREGKLGIPRNFVIKYGSKLRGPVYFEVPSGAVWQVELTERDERKWLEEGWREFAMHYSLKDGHFLVFRYEGNDRFRVFIFDKSAAEIEYPYSATVVEEEEEEEDANKKRKTEIDKQPHSQPNPQKRMKVDVPKEMETNLESKNLEEDVIVVGESSGSEVPKKKFGRFMTASDRSKALQKASGFKTDNPFFVVVMQPSFVRAPYKMCMPADFVKKHLNMSHGNVTVRVSSGQAWRMKCWRNRDYKKALLTGGWKAFAEDNALAVGDVCLFELTETTPDILFNMIVYNQSVEDAGEARTQGECGVSATDDSGGMSSVETCQGLTLTEKEMALSRASAFKSANPSFTVVMEPSYLESCSTNITYQFVKSYLNENGELSLRVSDGRTWIVDYSVSINSQSPVAKFHGNGWRSFALDNNLKVGDVCVFELIKANETFLDVVIFPTTDTATQCSGPQTNMTNQAENMSKSEYLAQCSRPFGNKARGSTISSRSKQGDGVEGLTPCKRRGRGMKNRWQCSGQAEILRGQEVKMQRREKPFNSKNNFFMVVIRSSFKRYMIIPNSFARKYLKAKDGGEATLWHSVENSWSVSYWCRDGDKKPKAQFQTGWEKFSRDNNLAVGDICMFKLLEGTGISFKVVIHRFADVANCGPSPGVEAASGFHSSTAHFIRVVRSCHLSNGAVDMPLKFIQRHFKADTEKVILQVADRFWPVKIKRHLEHGLGKLAIGWSKFAKENSLKVGDVCVYRLITSTDATLNVLILRRDG